MSGIVITSGGPDIEAGTYPGTLISVEEQTINSGVSQYNPSGEPQDVFVWTFDLSGDEDEETLEVSGVTSQMTGPKSKTMQFLRALGFDPQRGDEIQMSDLVGKSALCTVEDNAKGWPKITGLTAIPKKAGKAKPAPVRVAVEADAEDEAAEDDLPF